MRIIIEQHEEVFNKCFYCKRRVFDEELASPCVCGAKPTSRKGVLTTIPVKVKVTKTIKKYGLFNMLRKVSYKYEAVDPKDQSWVNLYSY